MYLLKINMKSEGKIKSTLRTLLISRENEQACKTDGRIRCRKGPTMLKLDGEIHWTTGLDFC
jgi:hypothetical protein